MTTLDIVERTVGIEYLIDKEYLDSFVDDKSEVLTQEIQQPHSNKIVNL